MGICTPPKTVGGLVMPGIYFRQKLIDYLLFADVFEAQIRANGNNEQQR